MSFNGSGSFALVAGNPVVTGTVISSTTHNNTMSDIATNGLSNCITKDGQTAITQNIPFNSKRLTGIAAGTALTDAARVDQIQNAGTINVSSVAGTNTITGTLSPTPSAYATGQIFVFEPASTNTGATTVNWSSLGAKAVHVGGGALSGGELVSGSPVAIRYDGTRFDIIANGLPSFLRSINAITTNYSVLITDRGRLLSCSNAAQITVTLLAAATAGVGFSLAIRNAGSATVVVDGNGAETVNGAATVDLEPGQTLILTTDGSNWEGAAAAISTKGSNAIINGGCRVAQRGTANVSATYQYGQVDRFACAADGSPSAGVIQQSTGGTLGTSGYTCSILNMTTSGGGTAKFRYRIESRDSEKFNAEAAIFSCNVQHDVGTAVDYTITINKADAADDFSAVTNISTSSATSVTSGVGTRLSLAVGNMGDCTNGIEIIVSAACGAVTTKDFFTNEWQLELGSTVSPFDFVPYTDDLARCQRYYYRLDANGASDVFGTGWATLTTAADAFKDFPVTMRASPPALEQSGTAGDYQIFLPTGTVCTSVPTHITANRNGARVRFHASGFTVGDGAMLSSVNANAYLAWSAEL